MFQLDPTGILVLAASVMGCSLAIVLFRQGSARSNYCIEDSDAAGPNSIIFALVTLFAVPLSAHAILGLKSFDTDLRSGAWPAISNSINKHLQKGIGRAGA